MQRITRLIGATPAQPGRRIGAWIAPSLTAVAVTLAATALTGIAAEVAPPKDEDGTGPLSVELQLVEEDPLEHLDPVDVVRAVDPEEVAARQAELQVLKERPHFAHARARQSTGTSIVRAVCLKVQRRLETAT